MFKSRVDFPAWLLWVFAITHTFLFVRRFHEGQSQGCMQRTLDLFVRGSKLISSNFQGHISPSYWCLPLSEGCQIFPWALSHQLGMRAQYLIKDCTTTTSQGKYWNTKINPPNNITKSLICTCWKRKEEFKLDSRSKVWIVGKLSERGAMRAHHWIKHLSYLPEEISSLISKRYPAKSNDNVLLGILKAMYPEKS